MVTCQSDMSFGIDGYDKPNCAAGGKPVMVSGFFVASDAGKCKKLAPDVYVKVTCKKNKSSGAATVARRSLLEAGASLSPARGAALIQKSVPQALQPVPAKSSAKVATDAVLAAAKPAIKSSKAATGSSYECAVTTYTDAQCARGIVTQQVQMGDCFGATGTSRPLRVSSCYSVRRADT